MQFIKQSHEKVKALHLASTSEQQGNWLPPRLEVSAAVFITGVNMPDHGVLFEQLEEKIHQQCSPYVVMLKATDCNPGKVWFMKGSLQYTG